MLSDIVQANPCPISGLMLSDRDFKMNNSNNENINNDNNNNSDN